MHKINIGRMFLCGVIVPTGARLDKFGRETKEPTPTPEEGKLMNVK